MTDLALRRLSGRAVGEGQPVMVDLVITDRSLLGAGDPTRPTSEPANVPGYGPVPVPAAWAWLADPGTPAKVRRLFTSVDGRDLVAMESRSRGFTGALAEMIRLRDQSCAAPWCDAPIRDIDHTRPYRDGGATSFVNGEGLCRRCNDTKEQPGWHVTLHPDTQASGARRHADIDPDQDEKVYSTRRVIVPDHEEQAGATRRVTWTTPTGRTHTTSPPPLLGPGWHPPPQPAPADDKAEDGPGVPSPGWQAIVNPDQDEEAEPRRTTPTADTHEPSPPPSRGPGWHPPPDLADDKAEDVPGIPSPGCHPPPPPDPADDTSPPPLGPDSHATPPPTVVNDNGSPLSTLIDIIWTPNSGLEIHLDAA